MACLPGPEAETARQLLTKISGNTPVHLFELDLGRKESVEQCARAFLDLDFQLHALVLNAGINGAPTFGHFTPGEESTFAINFLGHFLLWQLLHPVLSRTPESRVVITASESHRRVPTFSVDKDLPLQEKDHDPFHAYAVSNLCRILWTREMAKKVTYPVVCQHPGVTSGSGIMRHFSVYNKLRQIGIVLWWETKATFSFQSVTSCAVTQTWAALMPAANLMPISGSYLNGNLGRELGAPDIPTSLGQDDNLAKHVYDFALAYFSINDVLCDEHDLK